MWPIKAPSDGGRDGRRFISPGRERGSTSMIGADQTHFHSHHGQLHADTQTHIRRGVFFFTFQNLHFKVKSHAFQIQISVWLLYQLM